MDCRYKCQENISCDERLAIHESYYTLGSATEKRHFLLSNTMRTRTARPLNKAHESNDANIESTDQEDSSNDVSRPNTNEPKSRRKYTFKYFFSINGEKVQVCKFFFLGTLDISQNPVYTAHATMNHVTNTPTTDQRGRSANSRRLPKGDPNLVRDHIASFHKV